MRPSFNRLLAVLDLIVICLVVYFDIFSPTLIVLAILGVSLFAKQINFTDLGFKKIPSLLKTFFLIAVFVVLLQLFDIGVLMPIFNRLTGTHIDYSQFNGISGNYAQLALLLLLSWTLVAVGEEVIYRGYVYTLFQKLIPKIIFLPIVLSSLVFAFAHTEQGIVGMIVSGFDGLMFCLLKRRFDNNLWVSVLAHGLYNTIGILFFFYFGPIYQLW